MDSHATEVRAQAIADCVGVVEGMLGDAKASPKCLMEVLFVLQAVLIRIEAMRRETRGAETLDEKRAR